MAEPKNGRVPSGLRERRIQKEWELLELITRANPGSLQLLGRQTDLEGDTFVLMLSRTWGALNLATGLRLIDSHTVSIGFPRFFPSMPIEAVLQQPLFHPNVHPTSGFVCLWNRFSPGDTVIEAVRRLQRIVVWESMNLSADHLLCPEAARWYENPEKPWSLPLDCQPLRLPEDLDCQSRAPARRDARARRRLEPIG